MLLAAALPRFGIARLAFAAAVLLLAAGPVAWLINTWIDPAFDGQGLWFFGAFVALAAWSLTSQLREDPGTADERLSILLLAATALVRLAGQVLAIDTIGALALVIDVFALGRLAGLDRRVRAVSPFWLAAAFAFVLPLERIAQRSIGYVLQDWSAQGACGALSLLFDDVRCAGIRITADGADVLVDLPCSGARAMIVLAFGFAVIAAVARPNWTQALLGGVLALAAAYVGNVLRITLLAAGVALGPDQLGFDVMAQPWHDLVGVVALGAVTPVLLLWARRVKAVRPQQKALVVGTTRGRRHAGAWSAGVFLLVALAVVCAPRRPADIAARDISISAPERIGDARGVMLVLSERERAYFQQFGGAAVKASYGESALMLARTTSPLRHLHAPDECLRGLGFRVTYLGMRFAPAPTAQYRAVSPDGETFRVDVSFLSDRGHRVASVSEAVWFWLADRNTVWTAIQRITPEDTDAAERAAFEAGVFAALDVATQSP